MKGRFPLLLVAVAVLAGCGRGAATASSVTGEAGAGEPGGGGESARAAPEPREPEVERLWQEAKDGEHVDLARLYDREGVAGLMERAAVPAYRETALAALGCGDDFTALPVLAEAAAKGSDDEAAVAMESVEALAARPLRQRDPEDALELRDGCVTLLALAKKEDAPASRRARAASALRMLAATGCLRAEPVPDVPVTPPSPNK